MAIEKNNQRLLKSERLLKNPEFVRIQKIGRRFHTKQFIVLIADQSEMINKSSKIVATPKINTGAKVGVTITKKIEPTAVRRNRVKRMVRAAFRQIKNNCLPEIAISVIAKHGSAELKTPEVQRQLFGALKFNGFIREIKSF